MRLSGADLGLTAEPEKMKARMKLNFIANM